MNIPFVFYQLIYHGKTYVDGALANPYPVNYFDDGKTNILGIYMKGISKTQSSQIKSGTIVQKIEEHPLPVMTYSDKVIHAMIDQMRIHILQRSSSNCKHVCLETGITNAVGYGMTVDDKAHLLVDGFNQGKVFLSQIRDNSYIGPSIPSIKTYKYPPYYMAGETEQHTDILSQMNK
jgi:hypothetical protein